MYKYTFYLIIFTCSLSGCKNNTTQKQNEITTFKTINISDVNKNEFEGNILQLDSYVILSNEEVIGEVKKTIIDDDKIFILDNEPKIVCYDMQGNVKYKINNRGRGPKEFKSIETFYIDKKSNKLVAFDEYKRKLFFYNPNTGKLLSDISTNYMVPSEFGMVDGSFFFKNIDHDRFDFQKGQMYYLLYSETGKKIDTMFLPHDAVAEYKFDMESFYYNNDNLLFNYPFDNTIYLLKKGQITPLYEINLPNQLPMKKIEEKMDAWDLVKSDYSYGIRGIYESNGILHFFFTKDEYIVSCFYDLLSEKILYCGNRVLATPRKDLPFYSLINGIYNDKFFAIVSLENIMERTKSHPEYFSDDLVNIDFNDNPVLAFYKVNK